MLLLLFVLFPSVLARFGSPPDRHTLSTLGSRGPRSPAASDNTPTSIWPLPISDSRTSSCNWTAVTPNNTAATGLDCPYTGHGPDGSLDVCKAACVSAGGAVCTDINYNPFIPDCVFRKCVDPNHPNATPAPGYQVFAVSRPIVTSFGVSPPATFAFKVAPGSFSSPVLEAALARASSITFPYGPGSPSTLPGHRGK